MRFIGDIALDAEVRAIASGAITDGASVIVNADGTVSGVSSDPDVLGSEVTGGTHSFQPNFAVYDTGQDKALLIYAGNSSYGTAVVCTVSGTSVSFGTPTIFESINATNINAVYDPDQGKTAIFYTDNTNNVSKSVVATISGTSVSYGSIVTWLSGYSYYFDSTYDTSANKILLAYREAAAGKIIAGTISGTDISFGSAGSFLSGSGASPSGIAIQYHPTHNKSLVVYVNGLNSRKIDSKVVTFDGSSFTFGSQASVYGDAAADLPTAVYDSANGKIVVGYRHDTGTTLYHFIVSTISGTSVSYGTAVSTGINFQQPDPARQIHFNANAGKFVFASGNTSESYAVQTYVIGTVSGTSITLTTANYYSSTSYQATSTYDPDTEKSLLFYSTSGHSNVGVKVLTVGTGDNITSENYIGIANAAYADGQKATVKTTGSIARNIPEIANASTTTVYGESVASTFDSNSNKVVIAYTDSGNSDYGTAIVGTISGTGISFGTAAVFNAGGTTMNSITFDSNSNKVVIAYIDGTGNDDGKVVIGTVSGTNISFGSEVTYASARALMPSISFDTNSNKVLIFFSGDSEQGKGIVGTVSGTSISFGSVATFNTDKTGYMRNTSSFNGSTNKHIILFRDEESFSNHGKLAIATISGTNVSFGSKITFETGGYITFMASTFDSNANKTVLVYQDSGNSNYGTARVLSADGSLGTAVVFESAFLRYPQCTFDSNSNRVVITYRDSGNSNYGTAVVGSVSGTGISFGTPVVFETASIEDNNTITFDSNSNKVVIAYEDAGNSNRVTAIVGTVDSSDNSISFGTAAVLNSAPATLTIGQQYFVQTDGSLGTSADSPSVIAGTAIGTSDLIVKG